MIWILLGTFLVRMRKWCTGEKSLFNVPLGKTGGSFVDGIADLIKGFAEGTSLRKVAWIAVAVA